MSIISAVRLLCLLCWVGTVLAAPAPDSDHAQLLQDEVSGEVLLLCQPHYRHQDHRRAPAHNLSGSVAV